MRHTGSGVLRLLPNRGGRSLRVRASQPVTDMLALSVECFADWEADRWGYFTPLSGKVDGTARRIDRTSSRAVPRTLFNQPSTGGRVAPPPV